MTLHERANTIMILGQLGQAGEIVRHIRQAKAEAYLEAAKICAVYENGLGPSLDGRNLAKRLRMKAKEMGLEK